MIAQRFRPIGWVIGVAFAIMLLYAIQLQVANERGKLNAVDDRIAVLQKDIRRLNTEFQTRASMRQLERWNTGVDMLALSTPQARQFVKGEQSISEIGSDRFDGHGMAPPPAMMQASVAQPAAGEPSVENAALTPHATPKDDEAKPVLTAHDRTAQREISGKPVAAVHLASLQTVKTSKTSPKAKSDGSRKDKPAKDKAQ